MIVLAYVGNHAKDSLTARLGWNACNSFKFIVERAGAKYDLRGALATVLLGSQDADRWFCNELLGASVGIVSPEIYGPAQFMALALSMPGARLVPVPVPESEH